MKKLYLITYISEIPSTSLSTVIENLSSKRISSNIWLVSTDRSAKELFTEIEPFLQKGSDRIFIAEIVKSNKQGWISKTVWEWMKENA